MRSALALAASFLAGLAALMANLDQDHEIVPFFIVLTFAGAVETWATQTPFEGWRRAVAGAVALLWLVAGIWIGGLLVMFNRVWQASFAEPPAPELTYLGLTATVYHLLGLYGGLVLAFAAAFAPDRWLGRASP